MIFGVFCVLVGGFIIGISCIEGKDGNVGINIIIDMIDVFFVVLLFNNQINVLGVFIFSGRFIINVSGFILGVFKIEFVLSELN